MSLPPFLIGAALLFWGWQAGSLVAALPLALLLELVPRLKLRFAFTDTDYARIADLSTVAFVVLAVFLSANRGVSHGILAAFQWLPAALAPILLAQRLGASGRMPLTALFRYLRKLKQRDPTVHVPEVDVAPVYLALSLLAAGVANQRGAAYFGGVVLLTAWALSRIRPQHGSLAAWGGMLALAAGLGYAGQAGLAQLQEQLETWLTDWHLAGMAGDPYRSTTDIGTIGRLKLLDSIVLRVYAPNGRQSPGLLHRASFDRYVGTTWIAASREGGARSAALEQLTAEADGATWILAPGEPASRLRIATRLERGKALLALPAAAVRLEQAPVSTASRNRYAAVQVESGGDWIQYTAASSAAGMPLYSPPGDRDRELPAAERDRFEQLAQQLGLRGLRADEALKRVAAHFAQYRYSTWRESPPPRGVTALGDFVSNTRAGHCEYFAAAATLLLRAGGIPARYATGFAVLEYSTLEQAFVVRARHAHAWTRAWNGERWVELDTTPPDWFGIEEAKAPAWESLADLLRWAGFRWSQRGELEAGWEWFAIAALLAVILAWRLTRGKRAQPGPPASEVVRRFPGADSEFYALESALARDGLGRAANEPLGTWLGRAGAALDDPGRAALAQVVALHQRYRFDPAGIGGEEREALRSAAQRFAAREPLRR
jgi:hypothetical protein